MPWHYREEGSGQPLIILHGIGMSHAAWKPVMPRLSAARRVIAFDIAGFGRTAPLPRGMLPTAAALAGELHRALVELGIDRPVDIAGNSLGGSIALEAAQRGIARSVVAISPAGLWKTNPPRHVHAVFGTLRWLVTHVPAVPRAMVRTPFLRELALAVPISAGSRRMPAADARRAVDDLAIGTAFEDTFANTRSPLSVGAITVPVTVAFGDRDWLLPKYSRSRAALPAHARWIEQPGWGHVPMWVDPAGIAELILEGTR